MVSFTTHSADCTVLTGDAPSFKPHPTYSPYLHKYMHLRTHLYPNATVIVTSTHTHDAYRHV
eukprot:52254-Eustigmatos_ZCMA.PRE.1